MTVHPRSKGNPVWDSLFYCFVCALILVFAGGALEMKHKYEAKEVQLIKKFTDKEAEYENQIAELRIKEALDLTELFKNKVLIKEYMLFVNPKLDPEVADQIIVYIHDEAEKYPHVSEAIIFFTMEIESNFTVGALSKDGAMNLMQVMPTIWLENENPKNRDHLGHIGITDRKRLNTVKGNIMAGAWVLNVYAEQCVKIEYNQPKKFKAKGWNTIAQCTSQKYFGGNHKWYYGRLKRAAGNFWFWVMNNYEDEDNFGGYPIIDSPPMKIIK